MRVLLRIDVDAYARYVIAHYFRPVDDSKTPRTRATRKQVKRFVEAALWTCTRDAAEDIQDARAKAHAIDMRLKSDSQPDEYIEPREKQRSLIW